MTTLEEVKKKEIVDTLYWDNRVDSSKVTVQVTDGEVTLSGTVPSLKARQAAENDARTVKGITAIENQLTIDYPTPIPPNLELKGTIDTLLLWNSAIDSTGIESAVEAGIVTLRGTVPTYWEARQAEKLAQDLSGVLEVVNELSVTPSESIVDEDIAEQIVAAFRRDRWINADEITVAVVGGEVTLTGEVAHGTQQTRAEEIAASRLGVRSVENLIIVS
jgi:osmotically-inducible protein OsmY